MWFHSEGQVIDKEARSALIRRTLEHVQARITPQLKRVLLLPPDKTRYHSGSGELTEMIYSLLPKDCEVVVIPTLGQHVPHTREENEWMFGSIPEKCFRIHDWRNTVKTIGEVPAEYVKFVSGGKADWAIPVEINRALVDEKWDLVVNIGQVVPHEVLGFANHNKNYFIGLGGKEMICASHMMAGSCGIENNLGQFITPLRACYNKAEREYLQHLPAVYVQVVLTRDSAGKLNTTGFYVGDDIETYLAAARYAQANTIQMFDKPLKKVVTMMDPREFNGTWVANKAIYRARMAMADDGELIIIAPGVERFGEQPEVDALIRKYGYKGTNYVVEQYKKNKDLQELGHAAAHLLHGSSEGRFTISYAPGKLSQQEIESVGYKYRNPEEMLRKYDPEKLRDGFNTVDGEEIYFISSPSLGLWAAETKFREAMVKNGEFLAALSKREPQEEYLIQAGTWISERLRAAQLPS